MDQENGEWKIKDNYEANRWAVLWVSKKKQQLANKHQENTSNLKDVFVVFCCVQNEWM